MDFAHTLAIDRKNSNDFYDHTLWILFKVFDVVWQDYKQRVQLRLSDRLDDESLIVAEEKETATFACAFTSVKHLFTIVCWQQA